MTDKKFLSGAYGLVDDKATQKFYDDWAASYDAEISENGYATPRRCADALASVVADKSAAVLDLGCGTGLGGVALRAAGFSVVDGAEPSAPMLEEARKLQGVYRDLIDTVPEHPLPFAREFYTHIYAAGVISPKHAPASTVNEALFILPVGGCLVFSLNDHAAEDITFPAKVDEVVQAGSAELIFKEHGPHLPGIDLEAMVYVLRKL